MIILITASLSSKTHKDVLWLEMCAFGVAHGISSPLKSHTCPTNWAQEFLWILNQRLMTYFLLRCCCVTQIHLASPAHWSKWVTSKNAQHAPKRRFGVSQVTCRIGVLEESQSAFWRRASHTTALSVTSCRVDVGIQSGQAFGTGFIPFGDSSGQVIYRPYNVGSAGAC